jgi:hypothetical protein
VASIVVLSATMGLPVAPELAHARSMSPLPHRDFLPPFLPAAPVLPPGESMPELLAGPSKAHRRRPVVVDSGEAGYRCVVDPDSCYVHCTLAATNGANWPALQCWYSSDSHYCSKSFMATAFFLLQ